MSTRYDKKGPELFIVNTDMLAGVETLAKQFKKIHDETNYDFLMMVKTGLSKIIAITPKMIELSEMLKKTAKQKNDLADYIDQLFPEEKK